MTHPEDEWPRRPGGTPATTRPWTGDAGNRVLVAKYANIAANGGRQIVFKEITNASTLTRAQSLVDYITRQGTLAARDADGFLEDKPMWEQTLVAWEAVFRPESPDPNAPKPRNVGHFMVSAPAGSDVIAFEKAVDEWMQKTFASNYDYLYVLHDDTDNPHVHIALHRNGHNRRALHVDPLQIDRWRQSCAAVCRTHGLHVDASRRFERGATKPNIPQSIHHLIQRGEVPDKRVREFVASGNMTDRQQAYLARILREAERLDLVAELYRNEPNHNPSTAKSLERHRKKLKRIAGATVDRDGEIER